MFFDPFQMDEGGRRGPRSLARRLALWWNTIVSSSYTSLLSAPRTRHYCLLIVHITIVCSSYSLLLFLIVHITIVCSLYTSLLSAPRTGLFSLLLSACLCRVRKRPFSRLYPCLLRSRITSRMLLCSSLLTLVLHSRIMI
jgi:hypothetical protein